MMKKIFTFVVSLLMAAQVCASAQVADVQAQVTRGSLDTDRDKISGTVMDMLQQWDSQTYNTVAALLQQMLKYNTDELGNWGIESLEAMKSSLGGGNFKLLLKASVLTGKFKVVNGRWVKEGDADYLQFSFPAEGENCVAKLTAKGQKGVINLPVDEDDIEDRIEDIQDEDSPLHFLSNSIAKIEDIMNGVALVEVNVPENMSLVFTYAGFEMMNTDITVNQCTSADDEQPGLFFTANVRFNKPDGGSFEMVLNNSGYMPESGVKVDFAAKKDNNALLTLKLDVPGTFTGLDLENLDLGLEKLDVDLDVMGKVQVKGGISDLTAFLQSMNGREQEGFEARTAKANEYLNINLYYDGTNTVRGYLELQAYQNERGRWKSDMVIHFTSDNKTYTFEEYFSKENFPEVAAQVNALKKDFAGLLEAIRNKASGASSGGDVNGDNKVNGTDIQSVINVIVDEDYVEEADVNKDNKVNGTDIQEIINIIVNEE